MKDGEKRWIKRKGCRNAAKMWIVRGTDEDGEEYGEWMVVPMIPGKLFRYITKPHPITKESTHLVNFYFDPITGVGIRN